MKAARPLIRSVTILSILAAMTWCAMDVRADDELLRNTYFDQPAWKLGEPETIPKWWFTFSSMTKAPPEIFISREAAIKGEQSVRFAPQRIADAYQGLGQAIEVEPGAMYVFGVRIYVDEEDRIRGTVRGQLSIEWINELDMEVKRTWGPAWDWSLAPGEWHSFEITAQAHADAVGAVFVITHFDAKDGREGGTFYVDNVSVKKLPPPEPAAAEPPPAVEAAPEPETDPETP